MILVDTSAWIEFFRGRGPCSALVDQALADNEAALCGPIETELRRGLSNRADRNRVLPLLGGCHFLSQPKELWREAGDLGYAVRRIGKTVKSLDLLIAAYALSHSVPLLTTDSDFAALRNAGIGLHLVPLR